MTSLSRAPGVGLPRWLKASAFWALPLALFVAGSTLVVHVDQPRVLVRWVPETSPDARANAAREFRLAHRHPVAEADGAINPNAESFLLINPDAASLSALQADSAVASVAVINASPDGVPKPRISLARVPSSQWLDEWQIQSTLLLVIAGAFLVGSLATSRTIRTAVVSLCLLLFVVTAFSRPLDSRIEMGDVRTYDAGRRQFEAYFSGESVRFEAHLSSRVLRLLDSQLGANESSPGLSFFWLSRGATVWFAAMLLVVAASCGFTAMGLRYVALCVAMPASLMYFGYRELGYLALTPAVFPLVLQGMRDLRGRLEAGSVLCGLGAALHGFGLVSMAGLAASALSSRVSLSRRLEWLARIVAFAGVAYLGWIFIYVVVLKLDIEPGHATAISWRPLTTSTLWETRVNWAILSPRGALDIAALAWMVGLPLTLAAAANWRKGFVDRPVFAYTSLSVVFLCVFWPVQGLAVDTDLVVAMFPGIYAVAWLLAESPRGTLMGLLVLPSSHVVFWRVLFSDFFVTARG